MVALSEALEAAENFSGSGAMTPGLVAELTAEQVECFYPSCSTTARPCYWTSTRRGAAPASSWPRSCARPRRSWARRARVGKLDSDAMARSSRRRARRGAAHDRRVPRWARIDARRGRRRHGRRPRARGVPRSIVQSLCGQSKHDAREGRLVVVPLGRDLDEPGRRLVEGDARLARGKVRQADLVVEVRARLAVRQLNLIELVLVVLA